MINRPNDPARRAAWRSRVQDSLSGYFHRRSYPRTVLALLLLITGAGGFLISFALLQAGVQHMWVRYPIAVLVSYALLLGLIRLWVYFEQSRFDPQDAEIRGSKRRVRGAGKKRLHDERNQSWFDYLDFPSFGFDLDDGCLPVAIVVAVLIGLFVTLSAAIAAAPVLIAEVFLDVFLVTALYRRLRIAEKEHWLGTALRRTCLPAVMTALMLSLGGWALERLAPGARSIGRAVEQLRGSNW